MVSLVEECEAGEFFNETSAACELCPRHRYQDNTGQQYCEFCKVNFKTKEKGAKRESDCKRKHGCILPGLGTYHFSPILLPTRKSGTFSHLENGGNQNFTEAFVTLIVTM